ncbi:unnamed protein product [Mytilus coruscus]|uniref:Reverse transcriptase domain-containing protein n=1 Tax=Mytilus coruscus TaxID=42192 RepID=A0A6J8C605_MYTCO|nr:unnamed protein product [Mytilus coruscus]
MNLYALAIETLASSIRTNKKIKGINIPNLKDPIKLFQHADDCTTITTDIKDYYLFMNEFEKFGKASGAKINKNKTEILSICNAPEEDTCLKFLTKESVKTLGIWFEQTFFTCELKFCDDKVERNRRRNEVSRRLRPRVNNVGVQRPTPREAPAPEQVPVPEEVVRVVNREKHGKRRRAAPELQQADQPVEPNNQPPPQKQLKLRQFRLNRDNTINNIQLWTEAFFSKILLQKHASLAQDLFTYMLIVRDFISDAPFDRVYPYDRKLRLSVSLKHSKSLSEIDGFLWLKFTVKGSQGTPNPVVCQANLQRPCYGYNFKGYCHKSQCFTDIAV